jgi:hypothetical protein
MSFYGVGVMVDSPRAKRVAYIGVESWLYNDLRRLGTDRISDGSSTSSMKNFPSLKGRT